MKVLIAVDIHHAGAAAVIKEGVRWAGAMGATLDVAFCDEYQYSAHLIRDPAIRKIVTDQWARIQESNQAELRRLLALVPAEIRGEAVYLNGRAAEELIAASPAYDAILIATHGRKGLQHFFLGSVAERVIRRTEVPVVVLRLPVEAT
jgi:nucleotide-binding universal stress UspA family protein